MNSAGNRSPYGSGGQGFLSAGMPTNFGGMPTAMRSPTHTAPSGTRANFSTSSHSQHWAGAGQGRSLRPHPQPQQPPPAANSFINGIKNFMNGFMNPKLNCDFHLDHNRTYNPKYRNNYMADCERDVLAKKPTRPPEPHIQTVMFDIAFGPKTTTVTTPAACHAKSNNCEAEIVAIFTSEDFPALPLPKPFPSVTAIWAKEKSPPAKPPTLTMPEMSKQPPKSMNAYFEITCTATAAKPAAAAAPAAKTPTRPIARTMRRIRTISEDCDSEDSFIIFASTSPRSPLQSFNLNSSAGVTPFRPFQQRQRQISECSDDSFVICFTDDAAEGVIEFSDAETDSSSTYSSDDESLDSGESDEEEDDDDGRDCVDGEPNQNVGKPRFKTDRSKTGRTNLRYTDETNQPDSGFDEFVKKKKRVRFDEKPTVHVMHTWDYAYRSARKGQWERIARDRYRFKNRIDRFSDILNPVLKSSHREQIYQSRFCDKRKDEEEGISIHQKQQQQRLLAEDRTIKETIIVVAQ